MPMDDVDRPEDLVTSSRTQVPGHIVINFADDVHDVSYTVQSTQKDVPYRAHAGIQGTLRGRLDDEAPHVIMFPAEAHLLYFITVTIEPIKLTWVA